jgi:large subunit ribosomal protein L25
MSQNIIHWEKRTELKRHKIRRLREKGLVPAVVYGQEVQNELIQCPRTDILRALRGGAHLVTLEGPDGEHKVLVKDVQYDHLGDEILHVDFHRISLTEKMEISVSLVVKGVPEGVSTQEGVLETPVKELMVRCLPTDIPDRIEVDVSKLKLHDRLRLGEIEAPAGVEFTASGEVVLASVVEPKEEAVPEPAEAAAGVGPTEPEVIKKGKEEEAAAGAEPAKEEGK